MGKNPARTIRYYVKEGLLQPPRIEYDGKVKRAIYSADHLMALKMICNYKKMGYSLKIIKEKIKEPVYWSDEALEFMRPFIMANNYPADVFCKNKPATREEVITFLFHSLDAITRGQKDREFIKRAFVDKNGQLAIQEFEALFEE